MKIGSNFIDKLSPVILLIMLMSVTGQVLAQQSDGREYFLGGYLTAIALDTNASSQSFIQLHEFK